MKYLAMFAILNFVFSAIFCSIVYACLPKSFPKVIGSTYNSLCLNALDYNDIKKLLTIAGDIHDT